MANKRMFSLKIIDTDIFLDMPLSSQNLYFHLNMRADDDGFIANHKKIMRMIGCNDDDMKILLAKDFIIPFKSGICVIKHWKIHNYIAKDRYHETIYIEEKEELKEHENGMYTKCIQNDDKMITQSSLGKTRLDKVSIEGEKKPTPKHKYGEFENITLSDKEYQKCLSKYGEDTTKEAIEKLGNWKKSKGKKTKSDYATMNSWVWKSLEEDKNKPVRSSGVFVDNSSPIAEITRREYKELYGE